MVNRKVTSMIRRLAVLLVVLTVIIGFTGASLAHPLGNFSINHFTRIEVANDKIKIRYVVDMAEIPAFQELQAMDTDGDGSASNAELSAYADRRMAEYMNGLLFSVDGRPTRLEAIGRTIATPPGTGGLATLRMECDFEGQTLGSSAAPQRIRFEDTNHRDRSGWREVVVGSTGGISIFDSTAFGSPITDELKSYPEGLLTAPLGERKAEFSFIRGTSPAGSSALLTRDGRPQSQSRDRLAELISVPELTPGVVLIGLLIAAALGALHALSPGHGKTVVGAYLVGSRGTARHAAFLGLTVTITHTIGVFALGLITLFASQYVLPERLFPILSLVSGGIVVTVGLSLLIRRWRNAYGHSVHHHSHSHPHEGSHGDHDHHTGHDHSHHDHTGEPLTHTHGGRAHTHLPPGADGSPITWRSLLALGVSGGLLPCPSALVVLLSAISFHRVGYGLILVIAFSLGLAATLTAVGLLFVYAGKLLKRATGQGRIFRVLPVLSALFITCVGLIICYEALKDAGVSIAQHLSALIRIFVEPASEEGALTTTSLLSLGFVVGLKHAVEADHLAAVSAIVSERKSFLSSSLVGGLWGVGHTISLLIAGFAVLLLDFQISEKAELALELCVAVMLVALGLNAIRKLKRGASIHVHPHRHGARTHLHPHMHDVAGQTDDLSHHGYSLNARPLLVGMVHGLAGSGAVMLLVLSTISSPAIGFAYIALFGLGSIGGMLIMSALVSLPVRLTAARFARANQGLRVLAGVFSLCFGLFMIYEKGFASHLFG